MTRDLRTYLTEIRKSKDLKTIKKPVSLKYEIATITEKFEDSNAILFENVKGRKFPVVSNLIGTRARFAQAIGAKIPDIHQKMVKAISATKKPKISNSAKFFE
ncbi:MAG: UbiD family decarboxylase, partial [Thermoproteota archaeon]|nr:UbiD family decarboxylase [Thermoproteota archaeon]